LELKVAQWWLMVDPQYFTVNWEVVPLTNAFNRSTWSSFGCAKHKQAKGLGWFAMSL